MLKALLGEVSAHLRLGMKARRYSAIDFDHQYVADRERTIRLLRREPIDFDILRGIERLAPGLRWTELQVTVGVRELFARRQTGNESMGEAR